MQSKEKNIETGGVKKMEKEQKDLIETREKVSQLKSSLENIRTEIERLKQSELEVSEELKQRKKELMEKIKVLGLKEQKTDQEIGAMQKKAMIQIAQLPESKPQDEHSEEDQDAIKNAFKGLS